MEASAQPAKTAFEYLTVGNQAFKDSLERSIAAMSEMNAHSKKNLEALIASATAAAKGVETVGAHAVAYSKKSIEGHIAAAKALAAAKSIQEAVEMQTGFAKKAFETYVAEVNEISEITSASVKEALSPINERVTAMVERAQAPR